MNINEIISQGEVKAIAEMVTTFEAIQQARFQLRELEIKHAQSKRKVSGELFACNENNEPVSVLPEQFVFEVKGELYLIALDMEGEDSHTIKKLSALIKG